VFGIAFETPLVVLVLSAIGVLPVATLTKYRRHAIVILAIAAAVLTPADPLTMMALFVPLYLLYELSVLAARLIERRRAARLAEPEAADA